MDTDEVMRRYRDPRFRGDPASLGAEAEGVRITAASGENTLCGDSLSVAFHVRECLGGDAIVERGCYEGYGCSLCIASAEAVMEAVRGRSVADCLALSEEEVIEALGAVEVGRSRKKCLRLPLEAMRAALSSF
ncbi:iron-sulfur cluster assembly scaffold protein [Raoultibacter phocaeensis]|uniref:iron-sulfur cluster assembly scaffold protein n=1 Tax=Raoultibacter phocaeensis TaxID=2479841 RepID=UPI0015D5B6BB|nr:iron-sulfur cluster assembly scaffold protein [Raoultibacter phocaeensis]